jgi:hypothetical protein
MLSTPRSLDKRRRRAATEHQCPGWWRWSRTYPCRWGGTRAGISQRSGRVGTETLNSREFTSAHRTAPTMLLGVRTPSHQELDCSSNVRSPRLAPSGQGGQGTWRRGGRGKWERRTDGWAAGESQQEKGEKRRQSLWKVGLDERKKAESILTLI